MEFGMIRSWRRIWRKNGSGLVGSLLLHIAFLALWLTWSLNHPLIQAPPLKAMFVDLVTVPATAPGSAGGAGTARQPHQPTAVRRTGAAPRAQEPPPDAMEARIAALADLRAPASTLPAPDNDGPSGSGTGGGGHYTLADFVRAQILRKWWPNLTAESTRATPVAIQFKITRAGVISDIRIVDQARFDNDAVFHNMALSARNAAILASPIPMPPGHYEAVMNIAITLDPRAVLH
jgi:hypothetical protein